MDYARIDLEIEVEAKVTELAFGISAYNGRITQEVTVIMLSYLEDECGISTRKMSDKELKEYLNEEKIKERLLKVNDRLVLHFTK